MRIKQITLKEANNFVNKLHRHHSAVVGHKFSIGCFDGGKLVGVAIVGRPVNRNNDDGNTLEVTRLCTDGTFNACSILYGRAARIAKEFGYDKIITYILESECGTSLKASGWTLDEEHVVGREWKRSEIEFEQMTLFNDAPKYPTENKKRYARYFSTTEGA